MCLMLDLGRLDRDQSVSDIIRADSDKVIRHWIEKKCWADIWDLFSINTNLTNIYQHDMNIGRGKDVATRS